MFKKLLIITLSLSALLCCAFFPKSFTVYAEKQNITYVAFGDSIAEAYAINMKTKTDSEELILGMDESYALIDGSYSDLIREELDKTYNTTAFNFAYSGDTCQDLLDFLAEFYDNINNTANNSTDANVTYPSLTNRELYQTVKNANIITVCISANNILCEAPALVSRFLGFTSPSIDRQGIEKVLKKKILGDSASGIKGLKAEFPELLNVFYKLNPKANIYFTSVYNPYKVVDADPTFLSTVQMFYQNFTQENLNTISEITEVAISGGKDSLGNDFVGINNIIYDSINSFNSTHSSNFKYVDSKLSYDAQYSDSDRANYNRYVNIRADELTLSAMSGDIFDVYSTYFDPHPSYAGHELIASTHINAGLEVKISETFDYSTLVNNADLQTSYILQNGQSLTFNTTVDNAGYTYSFLYTIKKDGVTVRTITNNPTTINYSDYQTGTYDVYLSITATSQDRTKVIDVCVNEKLTTIHINEVQKYIVSFVPNCDNVIDQQEIVSGGKVTEPSVVKPNNQLVGWFTDPDFITQWNFSTDVVLSNITLYAHWQAITFDVTFDYNGGTLNGQSVAVVSVMQNALVEKPNANNEPILSKHKLIGWFVNLSDEQPFNFNTPITETLTLHAKWEKVVFSVTFNFNGGILNGQTQLTTEANKGDKLSRLSNEPVKEDCELVGWFKDVDLSKPWNFENDVVNADVIIFAKWETNVVNVNFDYQGGTFNGNNSRVLKLVKGDQLSIPTENADTLKKSGYKFAYWFLSDNQVPLEFPFDVLEDITIYAHWKEAININIYCYNQDIEWLIFKGTTVGELFDEIKPQKNGTCFLGWYEDSTLSQELENDAILNNNQSIFVKWMTLKCDGEQLLKQTFSSTTKPIVWQIDAKNGTKLAWQVNNEIVKYSVVSGNNGASWVFVPNAVGVFEISCLIYNRVDYDGNPIEDAVVNGDIVEMVYSTPSNITIALSENTNKKTYVIELDNKQYYDETKFVWFKTTDGLSDDFSTKIGVGFNLNYEFDSDCKICVKYLENEDSTDGLVSNIIDVINVRFDNYANGIIIILIVISFVIIAIVAVGVIIRIKKQKDYF